MCRQRFVDGERKISFHAKQQQRQETSFALGISYEQETEERQLDRQHMQRRVSKPKSALKSLVLYAFSINQTALGTHKCECKLFAHTFYQLWNMTSSAEVLN